MSKKIKELELNALRKTFEGVKDFVLLEPIKVDAATDFEFRKKLREKKIRVKLVKNSLVKKVFGENGVAGRRLARADAPVLGRGQHQGTEQRRRRDR